MSYLYSQEMYPNYENFIAVCPHCAFTNTYNRRDDLKTLKPIDLEKVNCLNFDCLKEFYINSDRVYEVYKYLILDISELKKQKRYMYCIINLAQALEAFLYYGIVIKLLFSPFKNGDLQLDDFNLLSDKFHAEKKIQTLTISHLKSLFFDLYLNQKSFAHRGEIERMFEKSKSVCFTTLATEKLLRKNLGFGICDHAPESHLSLKQTLFKQPLKLKFF